MPKKSPWRGRWMALATVLGRQRGYFIPHRYADALPGPGQRPPYAAIEHLFADQETDFRRVIQAIGELAGDLKAIGENQPPAPRWDQVWFPRLDAAAAYAMVRNHQPRRIVEVGSGHSTRFMARAVRDGGLATEISAIDPAPRAVIEGLPVELTRAPVHKADPGLFTALAAGDVLFIDSSHILMPGSDVDFLFGRVLPGLPIGALVHIHDIFLPDDYPADWDWRGYNEQLGVLALLQGGGYEILFASHYAATRMADDLAATVIAGLAHPAGAHDASLWLKKIR